MLIPVLIGAAGLFVVIAIGCWAILSKQKKQETIVFEAPKSQEEKLKKAEKPKEGLLTRLGLKLKGSPKEGSSGSKPKVKPPIQKITPKKIQPPVTKEVQLPSSLSIVSPVVKRREAKKETAREKALKKQKKARIKELKVRAKEEAKEREKKQVETRKKIKELVAEKKEQVKRMKKVKSISEIKVPVIEIKTKRPIPKPEPKPTVSKPVPAKRKDSYIELTQTLVGWRYRIKKRGVKDSAISEPYATKVAIMKVVEPLAKDLGVEIKEPRQID